MEPDLKEAARHYMLASFGGLPHARYNLAFLYERGAGVLKKSTDRCLQLLDAAAEAGHGGAASALAERLFKGVVRDRATEVEDFPEEAIYYWLLAAKEVIQHFLLKPFYFLNSLSHTLYMCRACLEPQWHSVWCSLKV